MKLLLVILVIVGMRSAPVSAQERYTGQTIQDILALPDDQIDLGLACLILAKDAYPAMSVAVFDAILDGMAKQLAALMQGVTDPEARIAMMNTYLYRPGWWNDSLTFTYDLEDLEAAKKDNQFLNGYLVTRQGSCITMPMLHLVLADRLGWPMYAVRSPKHFFVRYVAKGFPKNNIEATAGGGYLSNARYIAEVGIPANAIKHGVYLRTLSKKEYLASLLLNNARHWQEREHNLGKAIQYLQLAVSIDSTFSSAYWNLGQYYRMWARQLEQEMLVQLDAAQVVYEMERQTVLRTQGVAPVPLKPVLSWRDPIGRQPQTPSEPNPFSPLTDLPALFPQGSVPSAPGRIPIAGDPRLAARQQEFQTEWMSIQARYVPLIQEAVVRAEWHKRKARDLGIVLKFPETFFIRQAKSIELFRRTGKY